MSPTRTSPSINSPIKEAMHGARFQFRGANKSNKAANLSDKTKPVRTAKATMYFTGSSTQNSSTQDIAVSYEQDIVTREYKVQVAMVQERSCTL